MINVTKSFLPPLELYTSYLQGIWERGHLTNHGPLVMEVNSSPGLEGIETTTGKDVASIIIQYIEKTGGPHQTRTKGKG